jgi:hypothetical protein
MLSIRLAVPFFCVSFAGNYDVIIHKSHDNVWGWGWLNETMYPLQKELCLVERMAVPHQMSCHTASSYREKLQVVLQLRAHVWRSVTQLQCQQLASVCLSVCLQPAHSPDTNLQLGWFSGLWAMSCLNWNWGRRVHGMLWYRLQNLSLIAAVWHDIRQGTGLLEAQVAEVPSAVLWQVKWDIVIEGKKRKSEAWARALGLGDSPTGQHGAGNLAVLGRGGGHCVLLEGPQVTAGKCRNQWTGHVQFRQFDGICH